MLAKPMNYYRFLQVQGARIGLKITAKKTKSPRLWMEDHRINWGIKTLPNSDYTS